MTEHTEKYDRAEQTWRSFSRFTAVLRDSALGWAGYGLVLVVAAAGWSLSYRALHSYGMESLGETRQAAWLVPLTFDLAPLGLSIVVFRARQRARSALVWRLGIWAFTALSAWINWVHAPELDYAKVIAALLPISAVVLFEGLMAEVHKAALDRLYGGGIVPRLTLACWLLDPRRSFAAFKTKALRPLTAAEIALGGTATKRISSPSTSRAAMRQRVTDEPAPAGESVETRARELLSRQPDMRPAEFIAAMGVPRSSGYKLLKTITQEG